MCSEEGNPAIEGIHALSDAAPAPGLVRLAGPGATANGAGVAGAWVGTVRMEFLRWTPPVEHQTNPMSGIRTVTNIMATGLSPGALRGFEHPSEVPCYPSSPVCMRAIFAVGIHAGTTVLFTTPHRRQQSNAEYGQSVFTLVQPHCSRNRSLPDGGSTVFDDPV